MPTNIDLVKDLPADFEIFGQAVDTQMKTNSDAAINKSTVDAKGDLIAGTADNTIARLAVGANDTVLTADSSTATGLKWATPSSGGMTLITSGTLSGSAVDLTSISGYNDLQLVLRDVYASTAFTNFRIRLNANSSAVYGKSIYTLASGSVQNGGPGQTQFVCNDENNAAPGTAQNDFLVATFPDYANTTTKKIFSVAHTYFSTSQRFYAGHGFFESAGAITEINLSCASGNFGGGTYRLYGVK